MTEKNDTSSDDTSNSLSDNSNEDPNYNPSTSEDNSTSEEKNSSDSINETDKSSEDDDDDDEDNDDINNKFFNKYDEDMHHQNIYFILNQAKGIKPTKRKVKQSVIANKKIKKKKYNFYKQYNSCEKEYFNKLTEEEKDNIDALENKLITITTKDTEPLRFKFLRSNMPERNKKIIISKIENLNYMASSSGEYCKLYNWINILSNIPFNKFYEIPIKNTDKNDLICDFLQNIRNKMNNTIYGHKEAKEQIIRILAQLISYPKANGYIIGIQGSAGVGKTKLIKEGICNALNYPHAFISLGGAEDISYLRGHSYTYEGATYGKICESLIKTGIMNPLILFDELDKVSDTYKGAEIINTLIHITDPVQNDKFNDRYFEEIDFDISRSMIIFTYNDESKINPILKDRMIVINVPGYNQKEKLNLARDYLIPEILKQYNLSKDDIIFDDDVLKYIIENTENEDGVRNLKRSINNIVSWINMMRYVSIDNIKIDLPFNVTTKYYETYCKNYNKPSISKDILHSIYL